MWNLSGLIQFLAVDCDLDAARFFWNPYQGSRLRGYGMLNEAGNNVRVEDGVDLFRKDWVRSVRARLNRLCSWGNFNFEGAQRTFSVIQYGRGEDICGVSESRRKGVDSGGVPTRGVQREVYASDVWGNSIP